MPERTETEMQTLDALRECIEQLKHNYSGATVRVAARLRDIADTLAPRHVGAQVPPPDDGDDESARPKKSPPAGAGRKAKS